MQSYITLEPPQAANTKIKATKKDAYLICNKCEAEVPKEANYCQSCGVRIIRQVEKEDTYQQIVPPEAQSKLVVKRRGNNNTSKSIAKQYTVNAMNEEWKVVNRHCLNIHRRSDLYEYRDRLGNASVLLRFKNDLVWGASMERYGCNKETMLA